MINSNTILEPILLSDSHLGIYMMQSFCEDLLNGCYHSFKGCPLDDIKYVADKSNMENEDYFDYVNDVEQSLILTDKDGNEYTVQFNEDLWAVPEGYEMEQI